MFTEVELYKLILIQVINTKFHEDPFSSPRVFISDLVEKDDAKKIYAFLGTDYGMCFNHHAVTRLFIHKVLHYYAK